MTVYKLIQQLSRFNGSEEIHIEIERGRKPKVLSGVHDWGEGKTLGARRIVLFIVDNWQVDGNLLRS